MVHPNDVISVVGGQSEAILIGNVQYTDDGGTQIMRFFRVYEPKRGYFRRAETEADSQEWNYPD